MTFNVIAALSMSLFLGVLNSSSLWAQTPGPSPISTKSKKIKAVAKPVAKKKSKIQTVKGAKALPSPTPAPSQVPVTENIVMFPAKETTVDRLVVTLFKSKAIKTVQSTNMKERSKTARDFDLDKVWDKKRKEYQDAIVALLNERSYLQAVASDKEFSMEEKKLNILKEAKQEGVDGVLVGEFEGKSIEMSLESGASGRVLAKFSVPVNNINTDVIRDLSSQAVDAVVTSFPYRGFVSAVSGSEVKLNLGKAQGVAVGTRLELFEFEGNNPTFSSSTETIGQVRVTKIANFAAVGTVISTIKPISPFTKVAFAKLKEDPEEQLLNRVHSGFWLSLGSEFNYIDTQTSNFSTSLQKRIYEVPISPALSVGIGYKRLSIYALANGLSNASNKVILLQGNGTYEFYSWTKNRWSLLSAAGVYYANYMATVQPNAVAPLDSVTTYSLLFEERAHYVSSPHTKLFVAANLYYPVMSSDPDNGSSIAAASFGVGGYLGVRLDLSKSYAVEGGLQTRYLGTTYQSQAQIVEFQYGVFTRLLFLF